MILWTAVWNDFIVGEGDFAGRESGWTIKKGWKTCGFKPCDDSVFCDPNGAIKVHSGFPIRKEGKVYYADISTKGIRTSTHIMLSSSRSAICLRKRKSKGDRSVLALICGGYDEFGLSVDSDVFFQDNCINWCTYAGGSLMFAIFVIPVGESVHLAWHIGFQNQNGVLVEG